MREKNLHEFSVFEFLPQIREDEKDQRQNDEKEDSGDGREESNRISDPGNDEVDLRDEIISCVPSITAFRFVTADFELLHRVVDDLVILEVLGGEGVCLSVEQSDGDRGNIGVDT